MRAILIDASKRTVTEIDVKGLADMQAAVNGLICTALHLPNGDTLFVNDEGLLNGELNFFTLAGAHQPFAGNGLIVGPPDAKGETLPARSPVAEILHRVAFYEAPNVPGGVPEPGFEIVPFPAGHPLH